MKRKLLLTSIALYFTANLLIQVLAPAFLLNNLAVSLPFREAYYPTVAGIALAYVAPLVIGYLLGRFFASNKVKQASTYYSAITLCFGLLNAVGIVARSYAPGDWFSTEAMAYYMLLYPILLLVGMLPFHWRSNETVYEQRSSPGAAQQIPVPKKDYGIALFIGSLLFALNLLPRLLSRYLVGADVYYHAAKTQSIVNGDSLFSNPFFLHEKNYYYSIVYYMLAFISKLTHTSVITIWFLYIPVCSLIFGVAYYLFVFQLKRSRMTALLATIFVALSNQIVWADPSDRGLGYALLALSVLTALLAIKHSRPLSYGIFSLVWLLTICTHPEIAIHIVGITAMFCILLIPRVRTGTVRLAEKLTRRHHFEGVYGARFDSVNNLLLLLMLYILLGFTETLGVLQHFSITQTLIDNEIPLSLFLPIGLASFVITLFALTGSKRLLEHIDDLDSRFTLSIMALAGMALFYFLHLWHLYHRYFVETAFMGIAIIAASEIRALSTTLSKRRNALLLTLIVACVIASLIPKLDFVLVYARGTNTSLSSMQPDFDLIKHTTTPGSIILINPTNIINRYLPVYANRRIFAGSSLITKQQQWQVLSFCNGPFAADCNKRDALATAFFNDPTMQSLANIRRSYEVDYVLVNLKNPIEYGTFLRSDFSRMHPAGANNDYLIIDVRGGQ